MASGDAQNTKNMTYSKSRVPIFGALIDYIDTSLEYLRFKTFVRAERLHANASRVSLSATFVAIVCFSLGLVCNVKFEVVMFNEDSLPNDLHFMLLSKDDKLYIDDIDVSRVMWCIEASDFLVIVMSSLLIWNSSNVRSPLSEYFFLPWLGAALRGLFLRQAPTAGALIYTMAVINGNVNPIFLTSFSFLFCLSLLVGYREISLLYHSLLLQPSHYEYISDQFFTKVVVFVLLYGVVFGEVYFPGNMLEARLWLEIARLMRMRWERRDHIDAARDHHYEVETLWSNDDVQSVEVGNYVY